MSHAATNWAIRQKGLKPATKIVLWQLADCHNAHTGQCNPRQDTLAAECEMSRSTLNLHLAKLEEMGLIRRHEDVDERTKRQRPTHYTLAMDEPAKPDAVSEYRTQAVSENRTRAVSDFGPEPCPKNGQSRVLKSDAGRVLKSDTIENPGKEEPRKEPRDPPKPPKGGKGRATTDREKEEAEVRELLLSVMSEAVLRDFLAHRRSKRAKVTLLAAERIAKSLKGHPDPEAVVNHSIANGYTGLFPESVGQPSASPATASAFDLKAVMAQASANLRAKGPIQ